MTWNREHGFGKVEPCHLKACHEYRTDLVNEGRAVDAVYFDLTKSVDMVSHSVFRAIRVRRATGTTGRPARHHAGL